MLFLDNIYLIPLLPAFGAAIMFFFGRKRTKQTVNAFCVGVVVLAFLFACGAVLEYNTWASVHEYRSFERVVYTWLGSGTGHLNFLTKDGTSADFKIDAG